MKTLLLCLPALAVLLAIPALAQQAPQPSNTDGQQAKIVSASAKTTTARIAAPDETVNVNGKLMRVADVVAILSSDTLLELRPHSPEKQNSSDAPRTQPESKKHSSSLVAVPEPGAEPVPEEQKHLSD